MRPGHRAAFDLATACGQPTSLHEFVSLAKALNEPGDFAEIVAIVRVSHNDVNAGGRADAGHQGTAISLCGNVDDPGAQPSRDEIGAVGAAVIGDHNFSVNLSTGESGQRFLHTNANRIRLVQTRNNDGDFNDLDTSVEWRNDVKMVAAAASDWR